MLEKASKETDPLLVRDGLCRRRTGGKLAKIPGGSRGWKFVATQGTTVTRAEMLKQSKKIVSVVKHGKVMLNLAGQVPETPYESIQETSIT